MTDDKLPEGLHLLYDEEAFQRRVTELMRDPALTDLDAVCTAFWEAAPELKKICQDVGVWHVSQVRFRSKHAPALLRCVYEARLETLLLEKLS